MEDREKERLKSLKEIQKEIKKKNIKELRTTKAFTFILWFLLLVAVAFIIVLYSGLVPNTKEKFDNEFNLVYEIVKSEKNKKQLDQFYIYEGILATEREKKYKDELEDITKIIPIELDEDYYIIENFNIKKIGEHKDITGVYLVNYERELVFNLKPYIDDKTQVKTYILPEILEEYNAKKDIDSSGANKPVLLTGMKPVKYNKDTAKWEITTENDIQWYNYDKKQWANVVLSDYDGDDISNASMYVWIPRYAYKISNGNYNTDKEGIIAIKFLRDTTNNDKDGNLVNINNTNSVNDYVIHPAFKFENDLEGIWVSKFEASSLENGISGENYGGGSNSELTYKSIPNRYSWTNLNLDLMYTVSINMIQNTIYGLNKDEADTHLMKNSEWGAVAYLTQSKYGRNKNKLAMNNYYEASNTGKCELKTGYALNNFNIINYGKDDTVTCLWNTKNGVKASTTGNVYGIYDLSGGAVERTASYLNNGTSMLMQEAASLYNAENKYKDVYTVSNIDEKTKNYQLARKNYGDAVFETSSEGAAEDKSWYKSYSHMAAEEYVFFYRGGTVIETSKVGLFYFAGSSGGAYKYAGFRNVIVSKSLGN